MSQTAYQLLRERVVGGEFAAGERLRLDVLARQFGISRTPIREALNQLAEEGLIEIRPRRGTFVAKVDERTVAELYQLRFMIDRFSADMLARTISGRQVRQLARLLRRMAEQVQGERYLNYAAYLEADRAFHLAIVELVGNRRLSALYEEIILPLWLVRAQQEAGFAQDREAATSLESHRRILHALESGDPQVVVAAVVAHLDFGRNQLNAWLQAEHKKEAKR
ncbi:MAG: GntR family transcriptional regulator [Chloroflexota bacterium]|nr:GntR family transcriptional regulator [Chloroflexota bacterium]